MKAVPTLEDSALMMATQETIGPEVLPVGVRSRFIDDVNGLRVHLLESGYTPKGRPCLLLLHGFPELAFSWRKILPALAEFGFHVVAPDMRGYGRTTGWSNGYDTDVREFGMLNLVRDAVGLLQALGHRTAEAVIGHDFGSSVAGWCAVLRPDLFHRVVMMSAPFPGPPKLPFDFAEAGRQIQPGRTIHQELAALPRPRKHYQYYYSSRQANEDMWHSPQGLAAFLRAYFHFKSADWPANQPFRLESFSAGELAKMPAYYIMDASKTMAETVAMEMPTPAQIEACTWLTNAELSFYVGEYRRTGFQGGLSWYRCGIEGHDLAQLQTFGGRRIDIPSMFISGASDWGTYQRPHHAERMRDEVCTDMKSFNLIDGAGHWVQQEQPQAVIRLLNQFLSGVIPIGAAAD